MTKLLQSRHSLMI